MPITNPYEERELLINVSQSDEQAFRQLFNLHYNKLSKFIFALAKSKDATQELVQDVFVKVWNCRNELREVNNFEAWIYTIGRNHVFNHLKKKAREYTQKEEWEEYEAANNHLAITDTETNSDAYALIEQSIEKLPPQQKKILLLKRRDGLRNEEIALRLNLSLETVKKHFTLAMRFLRNNTGHTMEMLIIVFLLVL